MPIAHSSATEAKYRKPSNGLSFNLARRYFFGKKSAKAINIISWISVTAIAISAMAMTILLSVENGFEGLLKDLYKVFYPQINISASEGKWFTISDAQQQSIKNIKGIEALSFTIEDNVMISTDAEQRMATIKGVDDKWQQISNINNYIQEGNKQIQLNKPNYTPAIIGGNIAAVLGIDVSSPFSSAQLLYPKIDENSSTIHPQDALNNLLIKPESAFYVQSDFDSKYIIVSLAAAQKLLNVGNKISSVEIKLEKGTSVEKTIKSIQQILGNTFKVQSRYEQNKTLWMIMESEKWAIYIILVFVLLLASFNMVGSLSMLVIEKKRDISILKSMGAQNSFIKNIFFSEGMIMSFIGGIGGVIIGTAICLLQQRFGWIKLGGGSFIIDAYPVKVEWQDIILIIITVIIVGIAASWVPARKAAHQPIILRED